MRNETEIITKLHHYQEMLAGFTAARRIDRAGVLPAVEQSFPGEGMETLHLTAAMDKAIAGLPPEDQQWTRQVFEDYVRHTQGFLEDRIAILKLALGENVVPG